MEPETGNSKIEEKPMEYDFTCPESDCNRKYITLSGLNNHIKRTHAKGPKFMCDECQESFESQHARTLHKIKEHEGRRYQLSRWKEQQQLIQSTKSHSETTTAEFPCPECSKVFYTLEMFNVHRFLHDKTIPKFTCSDCGKEFVTKRKMKEHSIVHDPGRTMYKCNVCAKVFLRSQTLQYHRLICKAAFQCDQCVDSFMTTAALEKHKIFHLKETFTCEKCNKIFPNRNALQTHEKRHTLRMNYTCQICKETISTRTKFEKHIKDHLESNLTCSVCNEKFQNLVKYGYHKVEMHGQMRPYDCMLCSEEFCTRQELFVHLHNHNDTNTTTMFVCDQCNAKFSLKENFEQHVKSHGKTINDDDDEEIIDNDLGGGDSNGIIEEQRHPCTVGFCDQIFSSDRELRDHRKNFHVEDENPWSYACKIEGCRRTFEYPSRLERHMASHTTDELKCSKCAVVYYSQTVFQHHITVCHGPSSNSGPVVCSVCCQLFENEQVLKNHHRFCSEEKNFLISDDEDGMSSSCGASQMSSPISSPGNYSSINSPESILSVYVQNDCEYDSNFLPEL